MKNIKYIIKEKSGKLIIVMFVSLLMFNTAIAQKERKYIRKGTGIYEKALGDSGYVDTLRMQKAEAQYRNALDKNIDSFEAGFDLGASLFKQKKFTEAGEQYKILATKDLNKEELAKVYHNLGNSYFMDGKLQESIEAYKNSLKKNPSDTATKYNLAVAQKLLNDQKNNKCDNPNQDQNQDKNKDKQDQDKQKSQENKDQQNQDEQKQDKQEQEKQDKQDKQKQEEQQKASEEKDKKDGEKKDAMKPDEISKENAARILKANEQEEKELQKKLQKKKAKAKKIKIEKDW